MRDMIVFDKPILGKLFTEIEHPTCTQQYKIADGFFKQIFTAWAHDFTVEFNERNLNLCRIVNTQYNPVCHEMFIYDYYGIIPDCGDSAHKIICVAIQNLLNCNVSLEHITAAANEFLVEKINSHGAGARFSYPGDLIIDANTLNPSYRHNIFVKKLCTPIIHCFANSSIKYNITPVSEVVELFLRESNLVHDLAEFFLTLKT